MYNNSLQSFIPSNQSSQEAISTTQWRQEMTTFPKSFKQAGALIQAGFLVWYMAHLGKEAPGYFTLSEADQSVYFLRYTKEITAALEQLREQMSLATEESCIALIFFDSLSTRTKNALIRANEAYNTENYANPLWLAQQADILLYRVQNLGRKGIQEIRAKLEENGIRAY